MAIPTFSDWCANCALSDDPTPQVFMNYVLQALCTISSGAGGGGTENVTACRQITSDGVWGSIGDQVLDIRWFDTSTDPPTQLSQVFINQNTMTVVTGVTDANSIPCPDEIIGESCDNPIFTEVCATNTNGTLVSASVNGPVALSAGFQTVSILNIGGAAGVVDGQPLLAGEAFNLSAYWDPVNSLFVRTAAINIDGTGTTLRVRTFV